MCLRAAPSLFPAHPVRVARRGTASSPSSFLGRAVTTRSAHRRVTDRSWSELALAPNPAKRQTELFFLRYSLAWIAGVLCILVPFRLYERFGAWGYMGIGVTTATPLVVIPMLFPPREDRSKPWYDKYWVKAEVWIAIFSFIGNYFWTHYFYTVLGAEYTFPAHRLNDVPITLFLMTHAYFALYHALANVLIRATRNVVRPRLGTTAAAVAEAVVVLTLAYSTAFAETLTIAHFPYYRFKVRRGSERTGGWKAGRAEVELGSHVHPGQPSPEGAREEVAGRLIGGATQRAALRGGIRKVVPRGYFAHRALRLWAGEVGAPQGKIAGVCVGTLPGSRR